MGLIYLDACLLIYIVERHPRWGDRMLRLMQDAGESRFAISGLVKCECLVGPRKQTDLAMERRFFDFFARLPSLSIEEAVYIQAADLRARLGLRTPDALHLACAQYHQCEALWTNDERLARASHGLAQNVFAGG